MARLKRTFKKIRSYYWWLILQLPAGMKFTYWIRLVNRYIFILKNGFDARDTWSLDASISAYVLPRLKYFRSKVSGWPSNFKINSQLLKDVGMTIPPDVTIKQVNDNDGFVYDDLISNIWLATIDKMIESFEDILDDSCLIFVSMQQYNKSVAEREKKIQIGLNLFAKYFTGLWW